MNILVVDDEEGIREGTSSYLRLKGYRSRSASSVAEALALLAAEQFDLVVSDWRLDDELAIPVVEAAACACIIISGFPQEITGLSREVHVLAKPLPLEQLLALIRKLDTEATDDLEDVPGPSWEIGMPVDTRDRIRLVLALSGDNLGSGQITDDGNFVTLRIPWSDDGLDCQQIEALGGDMRVLQQHGHNILEYRLRRDGCPDGFEPPIHPADPWPTFGDPIAIDFHLAPDFDPVEFLDLVARCDAAQDQGREVCLLNIPSHLCLFLDALGRTGELPKRREAGPCLPEILSELWG